MYTTLIYITYLVFLTVEMHYQITVYQMQRSLTKNNLNRYKKSIYVIHIISIFILIDNTQILISDNIAQASEILLFC